MISAPRGSKQASNGPISRCYWQKIHVIEDQGYALVELIAKECLYCLVSDGVG